MRSATGRIGGLAWPISAAGARGDASSGPLLLGTLAALLVGLCHRLLTGWSTPLWFDETFSAVIATQPWGEPLWEWLTHELGGPVYYVLLWGWVQIAGASDIALRLPSLLFSIAGLAFVLWRGHPDRSVRLMWAGLLALYTASFSQASEARCYPLLMLLTTVQLSVFMTLLRAPDTRRAAIWVGVSALALLTHYHAAFICLVQGLFYLGHARMRAVRSWPALLLLVPAVAWLVVALPFLVGYVSSGATWYTRYTPWELLSAWRVLLDYPLVGRWIRDGILVTAALALVSRQVRDRFRLDPAEALAVLSGVGATLIVLGVASVTASFTTRYLLPYVPAVLLGVALWMRGLNGINPRAGMVVLLVITTVAFAVLRLTLQNPDQDRRYYFEFDRASQWIMQQGDTRHVQFLWDNPTAEFSSEAHLREVGGFFFRRAGRTVDVAVPRPPKAIDPFPGLVHAAAQRPGGAILWLYDPAVPNTRAADHPARLNRFSDWKCSAFGGGEAKAVACVPRR